MSRLFSLSRFATFTMIGGIIGQQLFINELLKENKQLIKLEHKLLDDLDQYRIKNFNLQERLSYEKSEKSENLYHSEK